MFKELAHQLPDVLKKQLIEELSKSLSENQETSEQENEPINIEDYMPNYFSKSWNEPIDLEKHKINKGAIRPLQELWKDELPVEDLLKIIRK